MKYLILKCIILVFCTTIVLADEEQNYYLEQMRKQSQETPPIIESEQTPTILNDPITSPTDITSIDPELPPFDLIKPDFN